MDDLDLTDVKDINSGVLIIVNMMITKGAAHDDIPRAIDAIEKHLQALDKATEHHEDSGMDVSFRQLAELAVRLRHDAALKRTLDGQKEHPRVHPKDNDDGLAV